MTIVYEWFRMIVVTDILKAKLHSEIAEKVFTTNRAQQIDLLENSDAWLFDFRKILMNGKNADYISDIFYETFKNTYPFQLCSLEIAGVPLMMSIMHKFYERGHTDINAFFIRKSRKKTGLARMVEGTISENVKIICVDDVMNNGFSFWRQVMVLEELGHPVHAVWSILRYRDLEYYNRFKNRNIAVHSIFTLDNFTETLGKSVKNLVTQEVKQSVSFEPVWVFNGAVPCYHHVVPKSQPIIDAERMYFGADDRYFRALNQEDGTLVWQFKVGPRAQLKSIFSNPALHNHVVIFGSYDGNVYALNKETGDVVWVFSDADNVGSSPVVADDLGLVFIGLEFGLFMRHGGIAALNLKTGEKIWGDYSHPAFTHSTPYYIKKHRQVVIGSNDGVVRLYNAKTGSLEWTFTTFGGASYDATRDGGFGAGDIKESFVYDKKTDTIIFGSIDGFLYVLDRRTGHLVYHYKCEFGVWSTPYLYKRHVHFSSLDKNLRCLNLDTKELVFEKNIDGARIFAPPIVINDRLYIGTNAGRLHELDPETGEWYGYFQATERITNHVVYNPNIDRYFLPTYANQIISIRRIEEK